MSKKKEVQAVTAVEDLGAVGKGIPQSAMPTAPFDKGANEGAAGDDGAEMLRGAQDDESLVQAVEEKETLPAGSNTSSVPAGHLEVNCPAGAREATLGCPLEGKANGGGSIEGDGAEMLRGAQDDNVSGAVQDNSPHQSPAVTASPRRGEAETGEDELLGDTEGRAKVKLIADRNGTVPEIKDGKILLRAAFGATVYANARRMIGCGVFIEIPAGYAGFILPSLRLRENWGLVCQGVRMPGESGEVSVTLINCGIRDCDIQPGEVIAEMVIVPCLEVEV